MGTLLTWSRTGADSSRLPGRSTVKPKQDNHSRVGGAEDGGRDDAGVRGRGDRKGTDDTRYPCFRSNSRMNATSASMPSSGNAL
jgi:hypothetical protein